MSQESGQSNRASRAHVEVVHEDADLRISRVTLAPRTTFNPAESSARDYWICVVHGGRALASGAGATAWEIAYARGQSAFVRRESGEQRAISNLDATAMQLLWIELK